MEYLNQIILGDCLEVMTQLPDNSVDMILADLPYGTTRNKWDSVIDLELLWIQFKRLIKPRSVIALTAQTPFDKVLGMSNLKWLKYEFIWDKGQGTGHLNANKCPLKSHENVLIFYDQLPVYNPQMGTGKPYTCKSSYASLNYGKQRITTTVSEGTRYPLTILKFTRDKNKVHPTQKPVALFEYLIKTYTNENATVLDPTIGSGTTAIAALNTGRNFIGIEKEEKYFEIANQRIQGTKLIHT